MSEVVKGIADFARTGRLAHAHLALRANIIATLGAGESIQKLRATITGVYLARRFFILLMASPAYFELTEQRYRQLRTGDFWL